MPREIDRGASGRVVGSRSIGAGLLMEVAGVASGERSLMIAGAVGILAGVVVRADHIRKMRRQSGTNPDNPNR